MPRVPRWTILQWSNKACEYIKPPVNLAHARLHPKTRRIPSIDKITLRPPDTRIPEFATAITRSHDNAGDLLSEWAPTLDHETLEEFALVLALKRGIQAVPKDVQERLERLGTFQDIIAHANLQNRAEISAAHGFREISSGDSASSLYDRAPEFKQELIDRPENLGPVLTKMKNAWQEELERGQRSSAPASALNRYLPYSDQCAIVCHELALLSAKMASAPFPCSLARFCRKLGDALEHAMLARIAEVEGLPYFYRRSRYLWGVIAQPQWTSKQRIVLGSWWADQALARCRFNVLHRGRSVSRPAFWRTWYMSGATKRGIFVLNQAFVKQLREQLEANNDSISSLQLPYLAQPRPWTGVRAISTPASAALDLTLIARQGHSTEGQTTLKAAIASGAMQSHLDGLNRLARQPWQINMKVLDHVVDINPESNATETKHSRKISGYQWRQAMRVARALGSKPFYLPMYMDFRGRAYAASKSILSFMGKDVIRALFQFGEAKPIGANGLQWLEVHLANLYGCCKSLSMQERQAWTLSHRDDIVKSAEQPAEVSWWQSAAKPFQTLAACFELAAAWGCPNSEAFESRLPVQLDGTCNGLQHLVSLAGDEQNAGFVNLLPSYNECGDIYTAIARSVSGPNQLIQRPMVKEAVMTFLYGVSSHRMLEILTEKGVKNAAVVASSIRNGLKSKLKPEQAVQEWLLDCARRITGSCRADQPAGSTTVSWTSPLGMPVVQPYVEPKLMAIRTPLQSFFLPSPFHKAPIIREKQLAGVVANFVHSLDAAHMLATCCALPSGVSFAAVHDSFWTHAASVPELNRVLRAQFADLYSRDLLIELKNEWCERYKGYMVLGRVYADSPLYEELISLRKGVKTGLKLQECLNIELQQSYEDRSPLKLTGDVRWENATPYIGNPGRQSAKLWLPLEFATPPARGTLDMQGVKNSPHFFS